MQSIYLLSRGFKFIINCSDCNWLQTALSNYSQTPLFYLLLLKVKLYYGILKNVILSQLRIIFHQGFLIFFKWLETGCLFHEKPGESKKKRERQKGVVLRAWLANLKLFEESSSASAWQSE